MLTLELKVNDVVKLKMTENMAALFPEKEERRYTVEEIINPNLFVIKSVDCPSEFKVERRFLSKVATGVSDNLVIGQKVKILSNKTQGFAEPGEILTYVGWYNQFGRVDEKGVVVASGHIGESDFVPIPVINWYEIEQNFYSQSALNDSFTFHWFKEQVENQLSK